MSFNKKYIIIKVNESEEVMTAQGPRYQSLSDSNYVSVDTRQIAELTRHKDGIMGDRRVFHIPVMVQVGDTGHYYKMNLRVTAYNLDTAMKAARVSAERFHTMDEEHFKSLYIKKTSGPQSFTVHKLGVDTMGMLRGQISGTDVPSSKIFFISVKDVRRAETIAFNIGPTCIGDLRMDKFFLRDIRALKENLESLRRKVGHPGNGTPAQPPTGLYRVRARAAGRIQALADILRTGRENGTPISRARRKDYREELTNLRQQIALVDEKLRSTHREVYDSLCRLDDLERFYGSDVGPMRNLERQLRDQRIALRDAPTGSKTAREKDIQETLDAIGHNEDLMRSREPQLTRIHNDHTRLESLVADMSVETRKAPEEPKKPGFFGRMMQQMGIGASGGNDQFAHHLARGRM